MTDRVVGLELGADDYVVKPFATGEVIARIRAVLRRGRGGAEPPRGDRRVMELRIDLGARRAWLADDELELTRKEFDLLARLARDAGRVVTRETLMSDVWDLNWFGSTKTLDVHIAWLRRKLGDDPAAPRFIHTVRGVGFPPRRRGGAASRKACLTLRLAAAGAGLRAAAGDRRARRPARAQPARARQRRGAHAGAGPGRPRRGDGGRPARARRSARDLQTLTPHRGAARSAAAS